MSYKNFLTYLFETFHIKDKTGIVDTLDKFQTILLDINTGEFVTMRPPKGEPPTFEELWELNKDEVKETNKLDVQVERAKGLIDKLWQQKKKNKK